jgi:Tol biopolymer transport system component
VNPLRRPTIRYRIAAAAAILSACAAQVSQPVSSSAGTSAAAPADSLVHPGERHLGHVRQLTFSGNNAEAYFSRSGRQLIFQRQEKVDAGCDQEYIMNIDGSGLRRISNGEGRTTCGYFYDHDRRVLYSSTHEFSRECPPPADRSRGYVWPLGHFEIYSQKVDGSDQRKLTSNGAYNAEATVSPDGSRIVFTSTRDGDLELYTMNTDGSDVRRVTHRVGYDGGAFFSPDGKHLVWRAQYPVTAADSADYRQLLSERLVRPARLELWIADVDGGNARKITSLGGANFAPFFHPDGRRIIFASNYLNPRGRNFDLFLINTDGSGLEQVTNDPDFDGFPMFSPDGKKLVWASNRHGSESGETDLFIADWVE